MHVESTISDIVPNAEIDQLSKRQKSRRKAKKGHQRLKGNQMLGKPLRNSKISEGGMSEKFKTSEILERSTEHTQRVLEDFDEFLCSPCTDLHEDILCDIELNPSIHPTI